MIPARNETDVVATTPSEEEDLNDLNNGRDEDPKVMDDNLNVMNEDLNVLDGDNQGRFRIDNKCGPLFKVSFRTSISDAISLTFLCHNLFGCNRPYFDGTDALRSSLSFDQVVRQSVSMKLQQRMLKDAGVT